MWVHSVDGRSGTGIKALCHRKELHHELNQSNTFNLPRFSINDVDAALVLNPKSSQFYLTKGDALMSLGQAAAASRVFLAGLEFEPYDAVLRSFLVG